MEDLKLRYAKEFYLEWFRELSTGCTHREAYERINERHRKVYGHDRYSSFESFYETKRQKFERDGRI